MIQHQHYNPDFHPDYSSFFNRDGELIYNPAVIIDGDGTTWSIGADNSAYIREMHQSMATIANELAGKHIIEIGTTTENMLKTYEFLRLPGNQSKSYLTSLGIDPKAYWNKVCSADFRCRKRMMEKGKIYLFDDVRPALTELKNMGIKIGLQTDSTRSIALMHCQKFGIDQFIDYVVTGWYKYYFSKPESHGTKYMLFRLGSCPGISLMVGDNDKDVIAGNAAGTATAIVKRDHIAYEAPNPDFIIQSLLEVPGILKEMLTDFYYEAQMQLWPWRRIH